MLIFFCDFLSNVNACSLAIFCYRLLSTHPRVTPVVVITVMTRCETPQILHHQIKFCGALIALKTNTVTTQGTVKQKVCILTELERGMVVSYL